MIIRNDSPTHNTRNPQLSLTTKSGSSIRINKVSCTSGSLMADLTYLPPAVAPVQSAAVEASFYLNGQPGRLSMQKVDADVQASVFGNTWKFGSAGGKGDMVGGRLALGLCTPGAPLPHVTVSLRHTEL
ncbi:hypothetical protein HDU76_009560 [Blyttiomyces sp. JEL0837]|nr:hypothetical protein HDU76_009560 [Blyttiomyces sp. JEL0837]